MDSRLYISPHELTSNNHIPNKNKRIMGPSLFNHPASGSIVFYEHSFISNILSHQDRKNEECITTFKW